MKAGEYVSIEELNEMYEMIEELPDYIVECLDEFPVFLQVRSIGFKVKVIFLTVLG